jgi:uncharacterized protein YlxW (UPF0749 family)
MFNKFHRCRRKHNMSAVDFSASVAEAVRAAALVASATAEFSAATANAAQLTQLQAENATLQAQVASLQGDLSTSQASEADLAAKLKAANDALAAVLPAQAPAA